jgi:hypothetical protein
MKSVLAILCALLAGCAAPMPSSPRSTPTSIPSPIMAATTTPSPTPSPAISFVCYEDPVQGSPAHLPSGYCPAEEAAVETSVADIGYPIRRIVIAPRLFPCGVPWPYGNMGCPPIPVLAAFVAFGGTDQVAALTIELVPNGPVVAKRVAFQVPPAGWSMP